MSENNIVSFRVKKEHQKEILNNISSNPIKCLLYRGLNAFIGFKTKLENALAPDVKEFLEKITINFILFNDPKLIFNINRSKK